MYIQNDTTLSHWLILTQAPQLGPITIARLLDHFGSVAAITSASPTELQAIRLKPATIHAITHPDQDTIDNALQWQQHDSHHIITQDHPHYPQSLKSLPGAPTLLYLTGNPSLLTNLQLAIVGSRKPTPIGKQLAFEYAMELSTSGLTITSGMALGIDASAHQGALASQRPTLAVLGCGVDRVYPKRHQDLAQQITEHGALISEFPLATPPLAENFPKRNRIISGLSAGVLVVEAAIKSGSLITAYLAADQGREVFAIPGSIHSQVSAGTHQLIQHGAKLVTQSSDITTELGLIINSNEKIQNKLNKNNKLNKLDPEHNNLLEYVQFAPTTLDTISAQSLMDTNKLNSMLLLIELNGYIKRVPGGYIRIDKS